MKNTIKKKGKRYNWTKGIIKFKTLHTWNES